MKKFTTILFVCCIGAVTAQSSSSKEKKYQRYENGELVEEKYYLEEDGKRIAGSDFDMPEMSMEKMDLNVSEKMKEMELRMKEIQSKADRMFETKMREMDVRMKEIQNRTKELQRDIERRIDSRSKELEQKEQKTPDSRGTIDKPNSDRTEPLDTVRT